MEAHVDLELVLRLSSSSSLSESVEGSKAEFMGRELYVGAVGGAIFIRKLCWSAKKKKGYEASQHVVQEFGNACELVVGMLEEDGEVGKPFIVQKN